MTTAKRRIDPRPIVESWNYQVRVGDPVIYRDELGKEHGTRTRSEAEVLSGHTVVVWIEGRPGCVALDRVRPVDAGKIRQNPPAPVEIRACRVCGCTDARACDECCYWLSDQDDLCSACEAAQPHVIKRTIDHPHPAADTSAPREVATCACGWTRSRRNSAGLDRAIRQHWRDVVEAAG